MFPQGGPGLALFLLRTSVAATFLIEALRHSSGGPSYVLLAAVLLISASLTIGFLTPLLSFVVCMSAMVALLIGLLADSLALVSLILNSAALALLGPGAYSMDARLFGRRVVVVLPGRSGDRL